MNLHQANSPDWEGVPEAQQNLWQRWAVTTNGIVTPANIISLLGAGLVIYGLFLLLDSHTFWTGVILIGLGRLADVADGYVADRTSTKSPLGRAIDATLDKIVLGIALIFFIIGHIIPLLAAVILIAHAAYNSLIGFLGHFTRIIYTPSLFGKYATAIEWTSIGLFLMGSQMAVGTVRHLLNALAWLLLMIFVLLALPSSMAYTKDYLKGHDKN